jgi:hypothetical protein
MRLENNVKWTPKQSTTDGLMCDKEEIKDFLDINDKEDIINYIYKIEIDLIKHQKALETARMMLDNRVTKDRYNNIVKKYNELLSK